MSTFEKAIVVLINVTLFALGLLALAGLSLLLSGCAHPELPVIPVEPVPITEVILPAHVEGGAWFCVELGHGTVLSLARPRGAGDGVAPAGGGMTWSTNVRRFGASWPSRSAKTSGRIQPS